MVWVHTYMSNSRAYMRAKLFSLWIPSNNTIKSQNCELKNHVFPLDLSSFGNLLGSVLELFNSQACDYYEQGLLSGETVSLFSSTLLLKINIVEGELFIL